MLKRFLPLVLALAAVSFVHAGTPLICHPYHIGAAKSLPGSDGDWKGVNPAYDRTHLVRDTLALLTPDTPIIVRMETLRRAALYATAGMRGWATTSGFTAEDRANTSALLEQLRARTKSAPTAAARALALFDACFFTETLRHTGVDRSLNGYDLIVQARELRGNDPDIEFALALASSWPSRRSEHSDHLSRARAGAKAGSLLAFNLATHFSGS
jgi:Tfp pilus assembly protein PilV